MIEIDEIQRLLPHAFPFLLVDRVTEYEPLKRIVGLKERDLQRSLSSPAISRGSPSCRASHYRGPGADRRHPRLQVASRPERRRALRGHRRGQVQTAVIPGDQLKLVLEVVKHRREMWVFDAKAFVDDKKVAEAQLMAVLQQNEESL